MNHVIAKSVMQRAFAGGNCRRYVAAGTRVLAPPFGAPAPASGVQVEGLGAALAGWRRMMSSAAEPTSSRPPSVEKKAKDGEIPTEKVEKGEMVVSSYWGISRPKITREDGTEWPWNCFMVI